MLTIILTLILLVLFIILVCASGGFINALRWVFLVVSVIAVFTICAIIGGKAILIALFVIICIGYLVWYNRGA